MCVILINFTLKNIVCALYVFLCWKHRGDGHITRKNIRQKNPMTKYQTIPYEHWSANPDFYLKEKYTSNLFQPLLFEEFPSLTHTKFMSYELDRNDLLKAWSTHCLILPVPAFTALSIFSITCAIDPNTLSPLIFCFFSVWILDLFPWVSDFSSLSSYNIHFFSPSARWLCKHSSNYPLTLLSSGSSRPLRHVLRQNWIQHAKQSIHYSPACPLHLLPTEDFGKLLFTSIF